METTKEPSKLQPLLVEDAQWILSRLPKELRSVLKEAAEGGIIAFVCGGFIRACIAGETVSDIDIITNSVPNAHFLVSKIKNAIGADRTFESDNATTIWKEGIPPIQVIHRWTSATPEELLQSFDFTIAKAGIWYDTRAGWRHRCDPRFYQDLAAKRLVYTSPQRNEDAGGSMLRVLKFYQRGYRIPLDSLANVIARLSGAIDTTKVPIGLNGKMDEAQLGKVLCGLLVEVDPAFTPKDAKLAPDDADKAQKEGASGTWDERIEGEEA